MNRPQAEEAERRTMIGDQNHDIADIINKMSALSKPSRGRRLVGVVTTTLFLTLVWTALIAGIVSLARCAL